MRNITPDKMSNIELSNTLYKMSNLAFPCHGGEESLCGLGIDEAETVLDEAAHRIAEADKAPRKIKPNEEMHEFVGCIIEMFEDSIAEFLRMNGYIEEEEDV